MTKLTLLTGTIILSGCLNINSSSERVQIRESYEEYRNTLLDYSIQIPERAYTPNKSPEKDQIFFGNISQINDNPPDAINVLLMGRDPVACSSFLLGISDLKEQDLAGAKVWTGKVDAFDNWGYATYEIDYAYPPPCEPPLKKYESTKGGEGLGKRIDGTVAYALCSEKDGKRVVVCIQQIKDDPKLAEEIFSTFRWTE